jgi:hypothetical protein
VYVHEVPLHCDAEASVPEQTTPHAPQFVVDESDVSHPLMSGAVVTQSANPVSQPAYWQVVPLHVAPMLCAESHAAPHALQLAGVVVGVSQPLVSGGAVLQSAQPVSQPEYTQAVPLHEAPLLWVVSHVSPQAPQFVALVEVSQPSRSGAVVLQSANPALQPVYWHVVPLQLAPVLWVVSQASPQAVQLAAVSVGVSQPFVSGLVLSQSAHPVSQAV